MKFSSKLKSSTWKKSKLNTVGNPKRMDLFTILTKVLQVQSNNKVKSLTNQAVLLN